MCGSAANPCTWDFQITRRYAGDNYKVFFQTADSTSQNFFADASPIFTAWKHVHIESDKMCRNGGILEANASVGDGFIYLAMFPDGSRVDTVNPNNIIHIFDAATPYESAHDILCARAVTPDLPNLRVRIDLGEKDHCAQPATLNHSYSADTDPLGQSPWDFSSGNSAGVCVDDGLFYNADPSDLRQGFDDAYVSFHDPAYGTEGAGVVPYLPPAFYDGYMLYSSCPSSTPRPGYDFSPWYRFANIWFQNKTRDNYLELVGLGNTAPLDTCTVCTSPGPAAPAPQLFGFSGIGWASVDGLSNRISLVFRGAIEYPCQSTAWDNATRETTAHEIGHQFYVNPLSAEMHDDHCVWESTGPGCATLGTCTGCYNSCCVMNPSGNGWDGTHGFCYQNLLCGDTRDVPAAEQDAVQDVHWKAMAASAN